MKRVFPCLGLLLASVLIFAALSLAQPLVESWVSSEDNQYQLSRQLPLKSEAVQVSNLPTIRVEVTRRYQTMLGLGSSLEACRPQISRPGTNAFIPWTIATCDPEPLCPPQPAAP